MRVKMILPALTEATSPFFRPIKYSLFPPLGLATLAAYLTRTTRSMLQDEHVERLDLDDDARPGGDPGLHHLGPAARYELADHYRRRGAYVGLGGLHVTSLPDEAAAHADTIFLGPGRGHLAALPGRLPAGRPAARLPVDARARWRDCRRSAAT